MTFKETHQKQTLLLPPDFKDFLGESHEAVILDELLREIDISFLEQSYRNEHGGSSAYHPSALLGVLVYGYMNGTFSSRKIAKRLRQDLAFMYLAGNLRPDFRTISRFRKEKGKCLESVLTSVIAKAKELGMVSFGACSLDGTKIRANASKERNCSKSDLEKNIKKLLSEAERIDREEDALYGEDNDDANDPELKTKKGRERRKKELLEKRKKQEEKLKKLGNRKKANLTDPDAKLMKLKQGNGYANAYNIESITEKGMILSSGIFTNSADQKLLIPTLKKCRELHNQTPKRLLADKGYSSEDNYTFCEEEKINAYIPNYSEPTDLSQFKHNKRKDTYTDKKGRAFVFFQHMELRSGVDPKRARKEKNKRKQHQLYKRTIYAYRNRKTGKKNYLAVSPLWQKYVKEQKKKLSSAYGKRLYKLRQSDVEGVFANIKKNFGFQTFSLRGLAGVAAEWTLISLAHNLKKLI